MLSAFAFAGISDYVKVALSQGDFASAEAELQAYRAQQGVTPEYLEGLRRYALTGQSLPAVPTPEPCRFEAATYAGDRFLVGGVFGGVHLLAADGSVLAAEKMGQPVGGLALAPRGDSAVIALADGRVIALALPG